MATASKPAASKAASKPKASTKAEAPAKAETAEAAPVDNTPAERTGVDNTVVENSATEEVPSTPAGEIAMPNHEELDKKAAEDAAKEGDAVDEKAKAEEDSVRAEIERDAQAVKDNPVRPEEEIPQAYIVGGEVPVNAPGTEGLEREPRK